MNNCVSQNKKEWKRIQEKATYGRNFYVKSSGEAAMPHTICLSVNNRCFMRCRMCDVGARNREKEKDSRFFSKRITGEEESYQLSTDVIKHLVDNVAPYGLIIRPNFVEPLWRSDILEIGEYVTSKGLEFHLITNGYLLPKKAEGLVNAGTRILRVSLDGPPEIHNKIRGIPDSYEKAVEGLWKIIETKMKNGANYPLLGVCFTISDLNADYLLDFYRGLHDAGLTDWVYVAFNFLKYSTAKEAQLQNDAPGNLFPLTESSLSVVDTSKIHPERLWEQIDVLRKEFPPEQFKYHFNPLLDKNEIWAWFDGETFLHPGTPCYASCTVAQIFYDGSVGVNGRCVSPSFGNILEQPFDEIWNSETACAFRRALKESPDLPACNRCSRVFRSQK